MIESERELQEGKKGWRKECKRTVIEIENELEKADGV